MPTLLYRLGRFSYRRSWRVIGVWLILLVGVLGGGIALGGQTQNSYAIPGTESQNALDRLSAVFPSVAGATAQAVVEVPAGSTVTDAEYTAAINQMNAKIAKISGVDTVIGPFSEYATGAVSADKQYARSQVQLKGTAETVKPATLSDLKATAKIGEDAGMKVAFGGQVFSDHSFGITTTELLGVIFAGIVLIITFGSLLAAGMPLLSALVGVGIVTGAITGLSAFTTVSSSAPLLALMIGLAVGIDYSLFILSRHRTQLANGEEPEESAASAVGTAGSAVVFAGVTVIIALLGLLVVNIPFLSVMGVTAALAVLLAIGVATTLVPALLGLAKGRLAPKPGSRAFKRATEHLAGKPTMGVRWVRGVMKRPVLATVAVIAVLGTLAIPALSLDLNLPDGASEPKGSTQLQAYSMIEKGFGAGYNGPLIVAVDITQTTTFMPDLKAIAARLEKLPDVALVSQGLPDTTLDTAIIQVIPKSAPNDPSTKQLVQSIRNIAPSITAKYDTPISVTGATAVGIDVSNRLTSALIPFGIVVVGLSVILLMMVFRSVLVPIKAAVGFLLSVASSLGIVVAIFQWGWLASVFGVEHPGPILSFMPIILMAVLFGLAMDYEVFLVSGMRESFVQSGDAKKAVATGFANGARVVTAAALIMFFVFFAFVPGGSGAIQVIALGLAAGVAFDAFLVRMTLVPAVMILLGRAAWWMPRWLQKLLPNMDIEGEHLRAHRDAVEWTNTQHASAISTEALFVGSVGNAIGPIDIAVPAGGLVLAHGDVSDRRLVAATLAGRLDPVSGRAQVVGHPVPSESGAVSRLVAIADVGMIGREDSSITLGELFAERVSLTQPRRNRSRRSIHRHIDAINGALRSVAGSTVPTQVSAQSIVKLLPQRERAVALAAVALSEGTEVVMLDQLDSFAVADDEDAYIRAVCSLANSTTTIVLGSPEPARASASLGGIGRPVGRIDLDALPRSSSPHPHTHRAALDESGAPLDKQGALL
jgi:RND superfamily putative drug exporter